MKSVDLIHSLILMTSVSLLSGLIPFHEKTFQYLRKTLLGLLFGAAVLFGIFSPFMDGTTPFSDGHAALIGLCGLFFGALPAGIATGLALIGRVIHGGPTLYVSIISTFLSAGLGIGTHYWLKTPVLKITSRRLWIFGVLVHLIVIASATALPSEQILGTLKDISLPVILFYPLATLLAGKILCREEFQTHLLNDLMDSEEELKTTLYSIGDAVISTDTEGKIKQLNPEAENLTGWTEAEAIGQPLETVFHIINEEFRTPVENPTQRVLRSGRAIGLASRTLLISKEGKERLIADRAAPIRDSHGQMTGVVLVFRDQTRERAAENALRDAERQWKDTFNATNDAICLLDANQKIIRCNQAMATFAGKKDSALVGKYCWEVVHQTTGPVRNCPVPVMLRSKKRERSELNIRGQVCEVTSDPLLDEAGNIQGAVHIIRDISARKKAEHELKQIEWMLSRKPVGGTPESFEAEYGNLAELNPDGLILQSVGREMLQQIASDYAQLLNSSCAIYNADGSYAFRAFARSWCRCMDQASRALCNTQDSARALASGLWLCHESCWTGCSKKAVASGQPVDIECNGGIRLYGMPILANGKAVGAICFGYGDPPKDPSPLQTLSLKYHIDREELQRVSGDCDSRPPYIIEMAKERLKTSARLIGLLVEIKRAETLRAEMEKQILHSQKMEAIGRLAGGIAHDFNNMLQIILGRAEILLNSPSCNTAQNEGLSEISKAALRSAELTRQLLAFARKQPSKPKVLNLNETVETATEFLRRLIGENIKLHWTPSPDPVRIQMDTSQLTHILTNLAVNARDSIDKTGTISIQTGTAALDESYAKIDSAFVPGTYAQLTVSDTGRGMSKETCALIFEPFFTTKPACDSSGLGLSTLYGIVRQNDGFVTVSSELGKGSVFKVYLPLCTGHDAVAEKSAVLPATAPRGKETILLVEDEETLLMLAFEQLKELGYTVLSSSLPKEALRLADTYSGEIHLLLTDVVMPEMSGRELSKRIKTRRPNMKHLFMSGYTPGSSSVEGEPIQENSNFLQKPFSVNELAMKIREILSAP